MIDHTKSAHALKALNDLPAREARRTALAFLVSEDRDIRDLADALADYCDASCVASNRREEHDEEQYFAAERMANAAHQLFHAVEAA